MLRLDVPRQIGKAYAPEEKEALLVAAKTARSPSTYPALMLFLNAGMRDAEIRGLHWEGLDLSRAYLRVGESKSETGKGRTIPLNSATGGLGRDSQWYTDRFGKFSRPGMCSLLASRGRKTRPAPWSR
jgi:integrase